MYELVARGFGLTSDWTSKWRMACKPITKGGDAEPKKMCACYFGHPSEKRFSMPFDAGNLRVLNAWNMSMSNCTGQSKGKGL